MSYTLNDYIDKLQEIAKNFGDKPLLMNDETITNVDFRIQAYSTARGEVTNEVTFIELENIGE